MTTDRLPMMGHLAELRSRLIKVAIALVIATAIGFAIHEPLLALLSEPYEIATGNEKLAYFRVTEAFSIVMRVSFFAGLVIASPVILYQMWRFAAPALTPREKRWAYPLTAVFVLLFLVGVVVGFTALQRGLGFLMDFGSDSLVPVIGADFYLKFVTRFILAFGIAFEFPVFVFAAAAFGVVSSRTLRSNRRWAVLIILVTAAFITPSGDPMTLLLLAVPLYILYELTILAIRFILKK